MFTYRYETTHYPKKKEEPGTRGKVLLKMKKKGRQLEKKVNICQKEKGLKNLKVELNGKCSLESSDIPEKFRNKDFKMDVEVSIRKGKKRVIFDQAERRKKLLERQKLIIKEKLRKLEDEERKKKLDKEIKVVILEIKDKIRKYKEISGNQ